MADRARPETAPVPILRSVRQALRELKPASDDLPLLQWSPWLEEEDGTGVRVALIDGGVHWRLQVFEGAQLDVRSFTGDGDLVDATGHGTRNAALLVGQVPQRLRGLAPGCELLVAKVLHRDGRARGDESLAQAIHWATERGADIIALPLGRGPGSARVTRAVRRAVQRGCHLYAAAGNRGPEVLAYPARLRGVTAVSAVDAAGRPLSWCCQSSHVDCYAPGEGIRGLGDRPMSGSSPATVIAAGVGALRLARQRRLRMEGRTPC